MSLITGIDLPAGSPGGSVELLHDLYLRGPAGLRADVFMLAGTDPPAAPGGLPALLAVPGKEVDGAGFWSFVERLATALRQRYAGQEHSLMHLQHVAFGATPALLRAFPSLPGVALVHGTDLIFAADHPTQAEVLREAAGAARSIVVPTGAMVDHLRRLAPFDEDRVEHIPWGIPDRLLDDPPPRPPRVSDELRLLYAGRLTDEKGVAGLLASVGAVDGVRVSVAAPLAEYERMARQCDLSAVRYLGWLSREELWRCFAQHDALVVPSNRLEAFGLVAVEAQACGLPVLYQPVSGLAEVLGDSALPVELVGEAAPRIADVLAWLGKDATALDDLRSAGHTNARRYPLSRTARELAGLSDRVRG